MRRSDWGPPEKDPRKRAPRWRPTSTLWHNLGEAVERSVARHRQCLHPAATAPPPASPGGASEDKPPPAVPEGFRRSDRVAARTRQRHAAICQLLADGRSVRAIAAEMGLARNTVRRFARAADPEELLVHDGTGRRASILDSYEPYLRERWNAGCTDASALWRELRARGYPGGYSLVRDYLARFRGTVPMPAPPPAPPKPRAVTSWIMTRPGTPASGEQALPEVILDGCPELANVTAHVRAFAVLITERRGRDLGQWMSEVAVGGDPALRSFVTGLRRDQDAVTAGLTLRWSSGAVEGHVNRKDAQAPDVWPRQPRPAPPPRPARRLTIKEHVTETVPEPVFTRRRQRQSRSRL